MITGAVDSNVWRGERASPFASLRERRRRDEWMDQAALDPALHQQALRGLARVNMWSRTVPTLWREIKPLAIGRERPLRVLDVASGGGEIARGLCRAASRAGARLRVTGMDVSRQAVDCAMAASADLKADIHFVQADALVDEPPGEFDVVICSLFLHHLEADDARRLLARMRRWAGERLVVSDLLRSRQGLLMAHAAGRILTRSPVVRVDGPLSVAAAFRMSEIRQLAADAGLPGARVRRRWPCRFLLTWSPIG